MDAVLELFGIANVWQLLARENGVNVAVIGDAAAHALWIHDRRRAARAARRAGGGDAPALDTAAETEAEKAADAADAALVSGDLVVCISVDGVTRRDQLELEATEADGSAAPVTLAASLWHNEQQTWARALRECGLVPALVPRADDGTLSRRLGFHAGAAGAGGALLHIASFVSFRRPLSPRHPAPSWRVAAARKATSTTVVWPPTAARHVHVVTVDRPVEAAAALMDTTCARVIARAATWRDGTTGVALTPLHPVAARQRVGFVTPAALAALVRAHGDGAEHAALLQFEERLRRSSETRGVRVHADWRTHLRVMQKALRVSSESLDSLVATLERVMAIELDDATDGG